MKGKERIRCSMWRSFYNFFRGWEIYGIPIPAPIALGIIVLCIGLAVGYALGPKSKELDPYNPSVASENTAIFLVDKKFTVKKINNQQVNWKIGFAKSAYIRLPSGMYEFVIDFNDGERKAENLTTGREFDKGKKYMLSYNLNENDKTIRCSIREIGDNLFNKETGQKK
jgi:hypothetical protein